MENNNSTVLSKIKKVNVFPTVTINTDDFVINGVTYEANLTVAQIIKCLQGRAKVYEVFEDGSTAQITLLNIQNDLYEEEKKKQEEALKLKHEYATFKKKEQDYIEKIKQLEQDLADVSTEGMEELRRQLAEANGKIDTLNSTIEELNSTIEEKDAEIEELNSTIEGLNATIAEKDENISQLTVELSTKTSELATTKETLQNTSDQLATATSELGTTKGQLSNALSQVETLNQQVAEKDATIEETTEQLTTAQELVASLNSQIDELNTQLEEVQGELDTAKEMIDALEEEKKEIIANSYRKVVKEDIVFGIDSLELTDISTEETVSVDSEHVLSTYVDRGFSYSVDTANKLTLTASGEVSDINTKIAYLIKIKEACVTFAEGTNSDDEQIVQDAEGTKYLLEYIDVGAELSGVMTVVCTSFNNASEEIADRILLLATFKAGE